MFKQAIQFGILSFGLFTFSACGKNIEAFSDLFPQSNPVPVSPPAGCAAGYDPIGLENPNATIADHAAIEKSGSFAYIGSEIYFEISEGGNPKTQVHQKEVAGGRMEEVCSNHQAETYPSGTDLLVTLTFPTSTSEGMTEMGRLMIEATDSFLATSAGSGGWTRDSIRDAVGKMQATSYRFFSLGSGNYELRLVSSETLEGKYSVKKTAVIRYALKASSSS